MRSQLARRIRTMLAVGMAGLVGVVLLGGCATTVTPPSSPDDPVTIYVAQAGKHSSILVERESGQVTEFGFSSWNWSVEKRDTWLEAIPTLLLPGQGTLCVNERPGPLDEARIRSQTEVDRLAPILVSRTALDRLVARLDAVYEANLSTGVLDPATGCVYVRGEDAYWVWHTCNGEVASWLRELGCGVSGPALVANFDVKPAPDRAGAVAQGPPPDGG